MVRRGYIAEREEARIEVRASNYRKVFVATLLQEGSVFGLGRASSGGITTAAATLSWSSRSRSFTPLGGAALRGSDGFGVDADDFAELAW